MRIVLLILKKTSAMNFFENVVFGLKSPHLEAVIVAEVFIGILIGFLFGFYWYFDASEYCNSIIYVALSIKRVIHSFMLRTKSETCIRHV